MTDIHIQDILEESNIQAAIAYLQTKKDIAGRDGVLLSDLPEYWENNREKIVDLIERKEYDPGIICEYETVSPKGKKRTISLMNAVDRMLARAASQTLSDALDACLYPHCYGFRPSLGTRDMALFAASRIEEGGIWVLEMDLRKFFETIPHELLYSRMRKFIDDDVVLEFMESYIHCRIENESGIFRMAQGLLQGSNISPLLSNLALTGFDFETGEKYNSYCRYGDDIRIFFHRKKAAETALREMRDAVSSLGLSVNEQKTGVFPALNRFCLGYEFTQKQDKVLIQPVSRRKKEVYTTWRAATPEKNTGYFHITHDGVLTRKDFTVLFENEEGKNYIPVETIDSINVYSNVVFPGGFFELAGQKHFAVNIINRAGEQVGRFLPNKWRRNLKMEMAQIRLLTQDKEHLQIARTYQNANLFNIRAVLRYYARRKPNEALNTAIEEITELIRQVNEAKGLNALMMYEAQARQKYYSCFNYIIRDEHFHFAQRTRRPPRDPLNAMISFGNTLLYTRIASEIYRSPLDIRFGILHSSGKRPENLNLDIADLFKPVVVDRTIFTLVNRQMIRADQDFEPVGNNGVYMTMGGKRTFIQAFEEKMAQVVDYKGLKMSYSELLRQEVRKLTEYFGKDVPYKPYKYVN